MNLLMIQLSTALTDAKAALLKIAALPKTEKQIIDEIFDGILKFAQNKSDINELRKAIGYERPTESVTDAVDDWIKKVLNSPSDAFITIDEQADCLRAYAEFYKTKEGLK